MKTAGQAQHQLKFRAWEQNHRRWCWSTEVTLEGNGQVVHHHWPNNGYNKAEDGLDENMIGCACLAPIQQFSGLNDRTGNEIYEGDIVSVTVDELFSGSTAHVGVVTCDKIDFEVLFPDDGVSFGLSIAGDDIEVLGNEHENPGLLTPRSPWVGGNGPEQIATCPKCGSSATPTARCLSCGHLFNEVAS